MEVSLIILGVMSHFKVLFLFVQPLPSSLQEMTSKSLVPGQQHLGACSRCKNLRPHSRPLESDSIFLTGSLGDVIDKHLKV